MVGWDGQARVSRGACVCVVKKVVARQSFLELQKYNPALPHSNTHNTRSPPGQDQVFCLIVSVGVKTT